MLAAYTCAAAKLLLHKEIFTSINAYRVSWQPDRLQKMLTFQLLIQPLVLIASDSHWRQVDKIITILKSQIPTFSIQ